MSKKKKQQLKIKATVTKRGDVTVIVKNKEMKPYEILGHLEMIKVHVINKQIIPFDNDDNNDDNDNWKKRVEEIIINDNADNEKNVAKE